MIQIVPSILSADLTLDGTAALLLGALALTVLNALARPALLLVLSPLPALAVPIVGLVVEVIIVIAVGAVVPGVGIKGLDAAVRELRDELAAPEPARARRLAVSIYGRF